MQAFLIGEREHAVFQKILQVFIEDDVEGNFRFDQRLLEQHRAGGRPVVVESHAGEGM